MQMFFFPGRFPSSTFMKSHHSKYSEPKQRCPILTLINPGGPKHIFSKCWPAVTSTYSSCVSISKTHTIIVPPINMTGIKDLKLHFPLLNANMCLLLICAQGFFFLQLYFSKCSQTCFWFFSSPELHGLICTCSGHCSNNINNLDKCKRKLATVLTDGSL